MRWLRIQNQLREKRREREREGVARFIDHASVGIVSITTKIFRGKRGEIGRRQQRMKREREKIDYHLAANEGRRDYKNITESEGGGRGDHENFIVTKPKSSYPSPPLLLGLWYLFIFPGLRKALQESVVLPGKQGFKLQIEYFLNYISLQPTKSIPQ